MEDRVDYREATPVTSEQILSEVGLSTESLVGKNVMFFGDGKTKLDVEGVDVTPGSVDAYDMFDEVVVEKDLGTVDVIISKGCPSFITDMSDVSSVGFLAANGRALLEGGEIRIAVRGKGLDDMDEEERDEWESNYNAVLAEYSIRVTTKLVPAEDGEIDYILIQKS